jgi:leader peptidase (prepilin peptidase)/N-methyltransferase
MENLGLIFTDFPIIALISITLLGAIIGSFINMLSYRIPQDMERGFLLEVKDSVSHLAAESGSNHDTTVKLIQNKLNTMDQKSNLFSPSHCPSCHQTLRWWHNIPLLSYLLLTGKCGHCHARIPLRYFFTELMCAALTLLCYWQFGYSILFLVSSLFVWCLLALAVIDFETSLLPDQLTLPLIWLGLIVALLQVSHVTLTTAVSGALVGYLSLYIFYWLAKLLTGKEGFGYGDFKLLAAIGAWLGASELLGVIVVSTLSALLFVMIILRVKPGEHFPFGPYLVIGALVMLFTQHAPLFSVLRIF